LKEAGQGSDGPSSARANNLVSRAAGKTRNYPTGSGGVRVASAAGRRSRRGLRRCATDWPVNENGARRRRFGWTSAPR